MSFKEATECKPDVEPSEVSTETEDSNGAKEKTDREKMKTDNASDKTRDSLPKTDGNETLPENIEPSLEKSGCSKSYSKSADESHASIVLDELIISCNSDALDQLFIESDDFLNALKFIQPSAKREGFATVPDVTWSDVGSLGQIREQLNLSIMVKFVWFFTIVQIRGSYIFFFFIEGKYFYHNLFTSFS